MDYITNHGDDTKGRRDTFSLSGFITTVCAGFPSMVEYFASTNLLTLFNQTHKASGVVVTRLTPCIVSHLKHTPEAHQRK